MLIFEITKTFPKEERYSLVNQIRRSARSVTACIAESHQKRRYPNHFISKLTDADMECAETGVWLDYAFDCKYIDTNTYNDLIEQCEEIGKLLGYMINNYQKFL